ncbi:MAG TPA: hypothetical protein VGN32_21385 [Ktedonobacterales bacterium]|nr:hypothetical protein [Ktedonobacterales bacterium]
MPNLTFSTIDRSRRASYISRALLVSTAIFALYGVEVIPFAQPAKAYAAPAAPALADATAFSDTCAQPAPLRRGQQAGFTDIDTAALRSTPGRLCAVYAHERSLVVTQHNPARPRPKPAPVHYAPPAHTAPPVPVRPASTSGGGGGGGGGYIHGGEPCGASRSIVWTVPVNSWSVPPGCFGGIYSVNPWGYADSAAIIGVYGWCNWWPEAITGNPAATQGAWHSAPWVGAVIHFAPGDQGAGGGGHWGYVESIGPNGWILISEMNMYWRGGGWQKVDYRYIHVDGGTTFI